MTMEWWETWRGHPMANTWGATDWDFLIDTALLHAALWSGDVRQAAELRRRTAKFEPVWK